MRSSRVGSVSGEHGASTAGPPVVGGSLAPGDAASQRVRSAPRVPSWGLKVVMAVSGTVFALYVLVHLFGNLKVFTGSEPFNDYAHWLRTVLVPFLPREGLLWIVRVALLACLVAHVWAAVVITLRARASRGPHRRKGMWLTSFTARTMPLTGALLLAFVAFHVLDLTTGTPGVAPASFRPASPDSSHAYENLVASLQRPVVAGFYAVTMLALGLHLAHGLWTVVTDLGGTAPRLRTAGRALAGGLALLVVLGNILIPIAVLTGLVS